MQRLTKQLMDDLKPRSSLSASATTSLVPESMTVKLLPGTPIMELSGLSNASHPLAMVVDLTAFPLLSEQ